MKKFQLGDVVEYATGEFYYIVKVIKESPDDMDLFMGKLLDGSKPPRGSGQIGKEIACAYSLFTLVIPTPNITEELLTNLDILEEKLKLK